ncbi:MAG: hypothetical protein QM727_08835 [Niabella sp.]
MQRRNVVKILAGLAGGAVLLPTGMYWLSPSKKEFAVKTIQKELSYLKLDMEGVRQFVNDYFSGEPFSFSDTLKWKSYYFLRAGVSKSSNVFELVRAYLLSSDFFLHKTDESKVVKYLGLFNPYKSPAPNPYSYVLYPEEN